MGQGKRQSMLLVEIVIAVLFFALCATVILDVFSTAYMQSARAGALSEATVSAQNLAERLKASPDWDAVLADEGLSGQDGAYTAERDGFTLRVTLSQEAEGAGEMRTATICATRGEDALLTLPAARYTPEMREVTP